MHSLGAGNFHGANNGWNIEVALRRWIGTNTDGLIGELHMFEVGINFRVHGNRFDVELFAGTKYS